MATKKKPAGTPKESEVSNNGLTQGQQVLCSLMTGVYAQQGMPLAAAQKALEGKGNADVELQGLMQRGAVFQTGTGTFALARDQAGNFLYLTGGAPAQQQAAPVQQAAAPQQPTTPVHSAPIAQPQPMNNTIATASDGDDGSGEGTNDDDLPWWTNAQFQQAMLERFDAMIGLLDQILKATKGDASFSAGRPPPDVMVSGPTPVAPVPTWPQGAPPAQQPPMQQQGYPQQGPPPMQQPYQGGPPPQSYPQPQQPQNGQPWQQPPFQNAQAPYPAPGQQPAPQQMQMPMGQQGQPPPNTFANGYQGGPPPQGQPQQTYGYPTPGGPPR